jgi:hypothetical protein
VAFDNTAAEREGEHGISPRLAEALAGIGPGRGTRSVVNRFRNETVVISMMAVSDKLTWSCIQGTGSQARGGPGEAGSRVQGRPKEAGLVLLVASWIAWRREHDDS